MVVRGRDPVDPSGGVFQRPARRRRLPVAASLRMWRVV